MAGLQALLAYSCEFVDDKGDIDLDAASTAALLTTMRDFLAVSGSLISTGAGIPAITRSSIFSG
jgi:hypothetical protein